MIKTVDTSTLRNNLADVIREVVKKKDFIMLTKRAKPMAALIDLDLLEELLALSSKDYLKSIRQARKDYEEGRTLTHAEVFGDIG